MKTLITFLGWVPVLGNILKVSYIASCAKEALSKVKVDDPGKIKSDTAGKYFKEIAEDTYDEHLAAEVSKLGLPAFLTNKAKNKAIDIIVEGLKEKYLNS